ncbi:hypothetical protein ABZP36_020059 [Zizania latifolia]
MTEIDKAFVFFPSDNHLTECYLQKYLVQTKLVDLPASVSSFHEVNVYSTSPGQLVTNLGPMPGISDGDHQVWYIFSHVHSISSHIMRKSCIVGPGGNKSWHVEGDLKNIKGSTVGEKL